MPLPRMQDGELNQDQLLTPMLVCIITIRHSWECVTGEDFNEVDSALHSSFR